MRDDPLAVSNDGDDDQSRVKLHPSLSSLAGQNATFLVALIWSSFLPRSEPQSQSTDGIRAGGVPRANVIMTNRSASI
jgi:hypothetical protein